LIKIIFCALNEAQNLGKFLTNLTYEAQLLAQDFEIIVCLDGSKDDSFSLVLEFAKFHPIKILPLKNQRGLGSAFKRLFLEVIKDSKDEDLIISLDSDNTHSSEQLSEMLDHFQKNNLDLLVASRFCKGSIVKNFPLQRRFISKTTSHFLQKLFSVKKISGEKLQDFTSGYRIYKAQKLKELFALHKENFINEPEFTYTCELLIKLARINCRIDEIPVNYNYGEKLGKSKLRIARNFFRLLILLKNLGRN
jgi:dolichol-phosphate mannosyltransferase